MQEEIPALIYLTLGSDDALTSLTLSDGFLLSRWIRPTFESLGLTSISFPALPNFLCDFVRNRPRLPLPL